MLTPTPRPTNMRPTNMSISPLSTQSSATKTPTKKASKTPTKKATKTPTKKATKKATKTPTKTKVQAWTESRTTTRSQTKKTNHMKQQTQHRLRSLVATVNSPKKLSQMLQNLCGDAGSCLAFGQYIGPTKKLFDGFVPFTYATETMRRMGTPSNNGFVYGITYERHGFHAETIMKCSKEPEKGEVLGHIDNLYYEYLVGMMFINDYNLRLPCFLETYGAFMLPSKTVNELAKKPTYPVATVAKQMVPLKTFDFQEQLRRSCKEQYTMTLLIQHIRISMSFHGLFKQHLRDPAFVNHVLPSLLFQVYGPLAALGNRFTHYDLHAENVLIYDVGPHKYVRLNYMYPHGRQVSFCTRYIAKIIDYGRSYFYVDEKFNSKKVLKDVCKACKGCGENVGYLWLNQEKDDKDAYYISSAYPNVSHDLRLLKYVTDKLRKEGPDGLLKGANVLYLDKDQYGTPENTNTDSDEPIRNVFIAARVLDKYMTQPDVIRTNETAFQDHTCVGNMEIDMTLKKSLVFRDGTAQN